MATYTGTLEDEEGNIYYPECSASNVKMANGATAQDTLDAIDSKYASLQIRIASITSQLNTVFGT